MKRENTVGNIAKRAVLKITEPVRNSLYNAYIANDDGGAEYRRRIQYTNITANIISTVCGGVFLTGLLLYILRDESVAVQNSYIGMIVILQYIANLLQFITPIITAKMISRRKFIVISRFVNFFINIVVLGIIPILPVSNITQATLFLGAIFLLSATGAVYSPAICLWHIIHLPEKGGKRSDWMAMSSLILPICNAVTSLLASFVVDWFELKGLYITGILVCRGLMLLLVWWDMKQHGKIPEPEYKAADKVPSITKTLTAPFKYKEFLLVVLVMCLWQGSGLIGQYWNSYLIDNMGMSYTFFNSLTVMQIPMGIIFIPIWAKIIKKLGWLRTFGLATLIFMPPYLMNLFMFDTNVYILYPIALWISYVGLPGVSASSSNLAYIQMPEQDQTECMCFYNIAVQIAGILCGTFGKLFIQYTEGIVIKLGEHEIINKQYLNIPTAILVTITGIVAFAVANRHKRLGIEK